MGQIIYINTQKRVLSISLIVFLSFGTKWINKIVTKIKAKTFGEINKDSNNIKILTLKVKPKKKGQKIISYHFFEVFIFPFQFHSFLAGLYV